MKIAIDHNGVEYVMAKAALERWRPCSWGKVAEATREEWRASQRAALAAAREAGLLPEVTP